MIILSIHKKINQIDSEIKEMGESYMIKEKVINNPLYSLNEQMSKVLKAILKSLAEASQIIWNWWVLETSTIWILLWICK